jgi:hypothetical protein
MDLGWIASAAPIVLGAGVGLVARRVIAANDQRRAAGAAEQHTAPPAGAPKANKTLRRAIPAGSR